MGYRNTEIEIKVVVEGVRGLAHVERLLEPLTKRAKRTIRGRSSDTYFAPPADAKADFIRLRRANHDDGAKLTIKYTKNGRRTNFRRVEKEISVDFRQTFEIMQDLHGKPAGQIEKSYIVFFMGSTGTEADTAISLYKLTGDSRIFLEVEAKSAKKVHFWFNTVRKLLGRYELKRISQSLYQLFVA